MVEYVCLGVGGLGSRYITRNPIYLIELLNFLNRPLLGNWPRDYLELNLTLEMPNLHIIKDMMNGYD